MQHGFRRRPDLRGGGKVYDHPSESPANSPDLRISPAAPTLPTGLEPATRLTALAPHAEFNVGQSSHSTATHGRSAHFKSLQLDPHEQHVTKGLPRLRALHYLCMSGDWVAAWEAGCASLSAPAVGGAEGLLERVLEVPMGSSSMIGSYSLLTITSVEQIDDDDDDATATTPDISSCCPKLSHTGFDVPVCPEAS